MAENKLDPITFEILSHKLWQITEEMGITLRRVSGSPVTVDAKDYMVGLYDAAGMMIMCGAAVLFHVNVTHYAIKYVIENYSINPGINEGDVYFLNDPYISALHQPDGAVLTPIFHEGELIGWAATMTHLVDIGGIDPGGHCPRAEDVFQEGFRFPGIKLVERGEIKKDIFNAILNMSRDPGVVGLDLRAEIAAGQTAKVRLTELVQKYGVDTFKTLCSQSTRYAEEKMKARIAELPDGTWRVVDYLDTDGRTDKVYNIVLTLTKKGDSLTFDYAGTSEQAPTFVNCGEVGAEGGIFGAVAPLLAYDIPWNQGTTGPLDMRVPRGTVIRAKFPAPCSRGSIGGADLANVPAQIGVSKMLDCTEKYKDTASALWGVVGGGLGLAGVNQYGAFTVSILMDQMGQGGGAKRCADGVDTAGHFWIPESTMPNIETYEATAPILYLYRRQSMDSGGPGKFRGGTGGEYCIMLHDAPLGEMRAVHYGHGGEAAMNLGLSGGYPSRNQQWIMVRDSDIGEWIGHGGMPKNIEELKGNLENQPVNLVTNMKNNDVLSFRWHGGGGYGDPIDRSPELVRNDVVNELVSVEAAQDVYGVIIDPQTLKVDAEKTNQKRNEIKKIRMKARKGVARPRRTNETTN